MAFQMGSASFLSCSLNDAILRVSSAAGDQIATSKVPSALRVKARKGVSS